MIKSCIADKTMFLWAFMQGMEVKNIKAGPRFVPSQWETALLCNDISHWLGASLEWTLNINPTEN